MIAYFFTPGSISHIINLKIFCNKSHSSALVHTSSVNKRKGKYYFTMEYQSLFLLLVLAPAVFSVGSKCPPWEDIYPCKCTVGSISNDIILVCKDDKTTLTELKSSFSYFFGEEEQIAWIELKNLDLGTLPSNLFDGLAVKELKIYNCAIDFEDSELPFKGLEDSLQYLTIKSSLTQKDGPLNLTFGHLEELKVLKLLNNKITELSDDLFTNGTMFTNRTSNATSNLHTLVLIENGIETIGERAFENLENLKYFELSGNKFGSLRRNMIPTSADHLEHILVTNNGLFDLPEDIFTSMPSLRVIDLEENNLRTLNQSTWENIVDQLSHIFLTDNPLQCDSDMEWMVGKVFPSKFFGTCEGPEGKEGLNFRRFLKEGI